MVIALLSYGYFEQRESRREEYYVLLVLAVLGAVVLVISRHFVSLFLGLETLSVSLYGLIAYLRRRERSDEAGIKYRSEEHTSEIQSLMHISYAVFCLKKN